MFQKAFIVGDSLEIDPERQIVQFIVEHEASGKRFAVQLQNPPEREIIIQEVE